MSYSKDTIKIKNKYIMFKMNDKKTVSSITKANTKEELKDNLKNKTIPLDTDIILITLEKTNWVPDTKISINMLGGPIKVLFTFYTFKKSIKKNKDDPRAVQFLFYTYDYYLKNKIKINDLKKIANLAFQNKLEKRPLAKKLINQIIQS